MRKKIAAILTLAAFSQVACYNSYFINKTELKKLESSVEPQEQVEVYGDCPATSQTASIYRMDGPLYAQNDKKKPAQSDDGQSSVDQDVMSEINSVTGEDNKTSDATKQNAKGTKATSNNTTATATKSSGPMPDGCKRVEVSASNALQVVTTDGKKRVTPFNFIMSGGQLVSPEYNLLVPLKEVSGAKVRAFSTWKTVGAIVGVSAVAIGTFVAVSVLAPKSGGFQTAAQ